MTNNNQEANAKPQELATGELIKILDTDVLTNVRHLESIKDRLQSLTTENTRLREALEHVKKHMETSVKTGFELSTVWNVANRALGE